MIIDTSYFQQMPLFIPDAEPQPAMGYNTPSKQSELQAYIDRMECFLLVNSLGYTQYNELKNQFEANGDWKTDAMQKWKDLVDGKDNWTGLRFTIGTNKISLIAYYVYAMYVYENATHLAVTGVQSPEAANSVKVNPTQEHIDKWNTFLGMYQGDDYLYLNWWNPIFFEWNGYPYYETRDTNLVSMWSYLNSYPLLYDASFFVGYDTKNTFGL